MKSPKYKQPDEFFKYLIEKFGYSIFNDYQKCLAIASDMFEGDKQVTFLIKTTFNNNVFIELLKARNSTSENKTICIKQAIKILTDDCLINDEKAIWAVGWLASIIYPNEWNTFIKQSISLRDNEEKNLGANKTGKTNYEKPILQTPNITSENINSSTNKSKVLESKNWTLEDINLEMIYCPAGNFMMGSPENEFGRYDDEIQHKVKVSKGFWIGKYPITQRQYRTIMRYNPSFFIGSNRPVDSVGEYNAKTFCLKINSLYKSKLPTNYRFVLPTEVQWEYACKANTTSTLNNGKNLYSITDIRVNLDEVGWYQLNSNSTTHPVGQKKPNQWGIYDMHGNVWEWCSDSYEDYLNYRKTEPINSNKNFNTILRGGCFYSSARNCRSATRNIINKDIKPYYIGFRVALVPIE